MNRQIPAKYRGVYDRAMRGRSLKTAVKAMCSECFGYSELADNIKNCTDTGCPLYPYRPYQDQPWKSRQMRIQSGFRGKTLTKPDRTERLSTESLFAVQSAAGVGK